MVGKSGDELTVKKSGEVVQQVKLIDTSQVSVFGNAMVTAQALREITAAGISICHFSYGGWFHAVTTGLIHKNVELRIAQFATAADPARSLAVARQLVVGKLKNSRTLLRRHLEEDSQGLLDQMAEFTEKAGRAASAETLLGLEGMAAKTYFAGFAELLQGGEAFNIEGRNRRPPRDPVNALLSFVYALLVKELTLVLHAVGFDPMLGFYHRPRYGRPSLALDMAEPFRPLIADSVVLTLVNNGEVTASDFLRRAGAVALTPAGRRAVIAAFERRLDSLVTHPLFGYQISYRRILEVQTRLLARTLLGEIDRYPIFCTR
jgi:CRISPR-associated protein Cas1